MEIQTVTRGTVRIILHKPREHAASARVVPFAGEQLDQTIHGNYYYSAWCVQHQEIRPPARQTGEVPLAG